MVRVDLWYANGTHDSAVGRVDRIDDFLNNINLDVPIVNWSITDLT